MELEYDHTVFDGRSNEADKSLLVRFFTAPIHDEAKSVEAGRPIFQDTDMIEIRVRGTKDNVVQRPIREDDKRRFRDAYRAYKDGVTALAEGTPLAQWPIMRSSQVEELKYLGFFTVEQIADANDGVVSNVPGLQTLKTKAKAFLEYAKGTAPLEQLQAKLSESTNALETATRTIKEMGDRIALLEKQTDRQEAKAAPATTGSVPKRV